MSDRYKNYLHNLGAEILDLAQSVKKQTVGGSDDYDTGRLFSDYEILDLMRQQAATFDRIARPWPQKSRHRAVLRKRTNVVYRFILMRWACYRVSSKLGALRVA